MIIAGHTAFDGCHQANYYTTSVVVDKDFPLGYTVVWLGLCDYNNKHYVLNLAFWQHNSYCLGCKQIVIHWKLS